MASLNSRITERRQLPDRRSTGGANSMTLMDWIPLSILIAGGLNWGLVGLINVDLVARLLGEMTSAARVVYLLVGISALYVVYLGVKLSRSVGEQI